MPERGNRHRWSSGIVLFISLALVAGGTLAIHIADKERMRAEAFIHAKEVVDRLRLRMEEYEGLLTATAGIVELQPNISRVQFGEWVYAHDVVRRYPGLLGIGMAPILGPNGQRLLRENARLDGLPSYIIYPPTDGEVAPIYYLEPRNDANDAALGFDMYSDPVRRVAMDMACREGGPVLSGTVAEIGSANRPVSILMVPLYQHTTGQLSMLRNEDARCWGLAFLKINIAALLDSLDVAEGKRMLRLYDGNAPASETLVADRLDTDEPVITTSLQLPHRQWLLETPAEYSSDRPDRWISGGITALGAAIALLLFGITKSQAKARMAAETAAEKFAERDRAQTTLTKLSNQLVSETDETRLFDLITDAASLLTGARHVLLLEETDQVMAWRDGVSTVGPPPPYIARLMDEKTAPSKLKIGPVRGHEGTLSLVVAHADERPLGTREQEILELLLAQAVVALNNSRHIGKIRSLLVGLEESHATLARSHRELDQLAYATSHDLRAPLRGLLSVTDWLEEDLKKQATADVFNHLHVMRQRILRLETMVDGVGRLTKAGRRSDARLLVSFAEVVREAEALAMFQPPAQLVVTAPLPTLLATREDLVLIMLQLFANAISHSQRPDLVVRVEVLAEEDVYRIFVDDNGCGIPLEFRERVWSPFETLHRRDEKEHTGLGLALVQKLVRANQGDVGIDESPEGGARIWFTWPRHSRLSAI